MGFAFVGLQDPLQAASGFPRGGGNLPALLDRNFSSMASVAGPGIAVTASESEYSADSMPEMEFGTDATPDDKDWRPIVRLILPFPDMRGFPPKRKYRIKKRSSCKEQFVCPPAPRKGRRSPKPPPRPLKPIDPVIFYGPQHVEQLRNIGRECVNVLCVFM